MKNELVDFFETPTVDVRVNTYWFYKHIMHDNYFNAQILIKMLAIDCYYGKNDYGFDWYNEMQYKRVINSKVIDKKMAYHEKEYRELIESYEKNGFLQEYPIIVNKDFDVFDGTHRLALALYFNTKDVPIKIDRKSYDLIPRDYSFDWFEENNMGYVKKLAMKKYNEIEAQYRS